MRIKSFLTALIFLAALLTGCNGPDSPEAALRDFIQYRFKGGVERSEVLEKSTGALYDKVESMSDEEFAEFSRANLSDSFSLKVLLSKCEGDKCFLTYTLTYGMNETEDSSSQLEVKKIAELHKIEKVWKVADVSELKTHIEMKNNLDIESN